MRGKQQLRLPRSRRRSSWHLLQYVVIKLQNMEYISDSWANFLPLAVRTSMENPTFFNFLVSRCLAEKRPKESRPFVRSSVRSSVRSLVTQFLENRSLLFSETLQLVRAYKRDKNVPSAFLKKIPVLPILAKNCPKLAFLSQNAQKWRFFAFFSQSVH